MDLRPPIAIGLVVSVKVKVTEINLLLHNLLGYYFLSDKKSKKHVKIKINENSNDLCLNCFR